MNRTVPPRIERHLVVLAAFVLVVGAASASPDPDLSGQGAGLVILGHVVSVESHWTADHLNIETVGTVAVDDVLRGDPSAPTVRVAVPGGTVDGLVEEVLGGPSLCEGQAGYLHLRADGEGRYVFADGVDGVILAKSGTRSKGGTAAGSATSATSTGSSATEDGVWPVIASVSPQIASAGTGTVITITGTGFGMKAARDSIADVGFTARDDETYWVSGYPNFTMNADDIVSWSDTQIHVRVPRGYESTGHYLISASSGSVRVVTDEDRTSEEVPFAVSFVASPYTWTAFPVFSVNENCPGVTGASAAIRRAATTWNAALPPAFQLDCSGTSTKTAVALDGTNLIAWGPTPRTAIFHYTSGEIGEVDLILNSSVPWTTGTGGSALSIESLMLRSLGQAIGLQELYGQEPAGPTDTGKAMFQTRSDRYGNANLLTLPAADRAGANYLYGGGPANPPLLAAAFAVEYTDGAGGPTSRSVRFSDRTIGGATAWAWSFGDGGTSTERNPVHVYAAPGSYAISLTASAAGYPSDTISASVTIVAKVVTVPGGTGLPADTNGDGMYDDLNGNGRADFADVVLYFNQMTWIAANEPVTAFDCNGNGRIDFADVAWLFNHL
ncbi:MAG: PKD domain-containing protein [Methanospirillum sp.]